MGVKIIKKKLPDTEPTVELFTLGDGDDERSYHVPARPRPNISLKYLRMVREDGEAVATSYLLEALLGKDGFRDLSEYEGLEPEDLQAVMKAARELTMSSVVPDKS